jgi:hypothetical protein
MISPPPLKPDEMCLFFFLQPTTQINVFFALHAKYFDSSLKMWNAEYKLKPQFRTEGLKIDIKGFEPVTFG